MLARCLQLGRTHSLHKTWKRQHALTEVNQNQALALILPARPYSQEFMAMRTIIDKKIAGIASTLQDVKISSGQEATGQLRLSFRELQADLCQIQELAGIVYYSRGVLCAHISML
jgi:hypothetical protein